MKKKITSLFVSLAFSVSYLAFPIAADEALENTTNAIISNELLSVMAASSVSDKIPVGIWTAEINTEVVEAIALQKTGLNREKIRDMVAKGNGDTLTSEQVDEYIAAEREIYKRLQTQEHQTFMNEHAFLKSASAVKTTFISSYSPMIIAELTKSQVQTLAKDMNVRTLSYSPRYVLENEMDISVPLIRADYVRDTKGYTGKGVKIGMIEEALPIVDDARYGLFAQNRVHMLGNNPSNVSLSKKEHATAVASIMVSQGHDDPELSYPGIAPDAELYCVAPTNYFAGIELLIDNGVNIINMSAAVHDDNDDTNENNERQYGQYTYFETWTDHIAINHSVHFVNSAGNYGGNNPSLDITHPGLAYNVITVGNLFDSLTLEISDDELDWRSATAEEDSAPNKPDIVAPGTFIGTSAFPSESFSSGEGVSGTSFAAPHVTGAIAQILETAPALKVLQDTVKAIITASVNHGKHQYTSADRNFDEYGAGVIDARSTCTTTVLYNYTNSTFNANATADSTKTFTFSVTSSDDVKRVSLAWLKNNQILSGSHNTSSSSVSEGDLADLDLTIIAPNGTIIPLSVAASDNSNDNLIIIQFDPAVYGYGNYTARVTLKTPSERKVYFSLAWW